MTPEPSTGGGGNSHRQGGEVVPCIIPSAMEKEAGVGRDEDSDISSSCLASVVVWR